MTEKEIGNSTRRSPLRACAKSLSVCRTSDPGNSTSPRFWTKEVLSATGQLDLPKVAPPRGRARGTLLAEGALGELLRGVLGDGILGEGGQDGCQGREPGVEIREPH